MISKIKMMMEMTRITKKNAEKFLENVPPDKVFRLENDGLLNNLRDLSKALQTMEDATFQHHVNKERNDFHNWIRDVIGDKKLAREIEKAKSKSSMSKKVGKRVEQLKRTSGKK